MPHAVCDPGTALWPRGAHSRHATRQVLTMAPDPGYEPTTEATRELLREVAPNASAVARALNAIEGVDEVGAQIAAQRADIERALEEVREEQTMSFGLLRRVRSVLGLET